jgi:hypothetical protein
VSLYKNTVPFFVCQANYAQCIANNPNDLQAQDWCKGNETCGTLNATATSAVTTTIISAPASTQTAAVSSSESASASASTPTAAKSSGAAVALKMAQDHSTGLFTAVLLAAFGLVL